MDSVFGAFSGARSDRSFASLKNLNRLSVPVQQHLVKVYQTLAAALLVAGVGVYLHLLWGFGGLLTGLGSVALTVWLLATPSTPSEEGKRLKLFASAAFLHGASIGPLVGVVMDLDSSILVTALIGTACIFGCFSGAAILARRRELLFLGGILSSAVSLLFWLGTASYFFGGSSTYLAVELYVGLLVFIGYVLFDTQMIIERADMGNYDYVKHSMDLFVDFMGLFVRLLVILAKNSSEKSVKERKQRKGNSSFR
ncbi:hypothetical protein L7F22_038596 [Adiantum nelumboides]|nr:hypothetical protein [Adiantum nelumboides]